MSIVKRRRREEIHADEIDMLLHRALSKAENWSERDPAWRNVAQFLRSARASVRPLMHPEDRDAAVG